MKRLILFVFVLILLAPQALHAAPLVQEIISPGGIKAWLVEDHKLPVIALRFAFRGGVEQDPVEKQGLAALAAHLITQGAGPYDDFAFQSLISDNALQLQITAGRDSLYGGLKTLRETRKMGFDLLHLALSQPRFEVEAIQRAKAQQIAQQKHIESMPEWQAKWALFSAAFRDHPYGYRSLGTPESIASITPQDLRDFVATRLARDNLIVAVAGAITPNELKQVLDRVFGGLPAKADLKLIAKAPWPDAPDLIRIPRKGTQVQALFAAPAPPRDDPDFYAAEVANYILGGGGFASRLMEKLRDEKGLTYGVRTSLAPMDQAALVMGSFATETQKADQAWDLVRQVWDRLRADGPSDAEVTAAKAYLIGSMPLELTNTDAIAGRLVSYQLDHLPPDFWDVYPQEIEKIDTAQIRAVLKRWFDPDRRLCVMVGGV